MIPVLHTIQTADRIFETSGSRPFLITCNDMNSYVCKYNSGIGAATRLMCEILGASFSKLWDLKVPEFSLINVNRDHVPEGFNIYGYQFDIPCFGSRYLRHYVEINDFTADISPQKRRIYSNRMDLFYIALFDIWLANEDRNYNNYNLLIDIDNQNHIVPLIMRLFLILV